MAKSESEPYSMDEHLKVLESHLRRLFERENTGHDLHHLKRVYNLALLIQRAEGGDRLVIGAAAYLHDIHRLMEMEARAYVPPQDSLPVIASILSDAGYDGAQANAVLHCIEYHAEHGFSGPGRIAFDLETLILQDADNLDAMGAIGIGRTFAFGAVNGLPMWNPEMSHARSTYDEALQDVTTIDHFYNKLLKLKDNMNTRTGKKIANRRHRFMRLFLEHFVGEWEGRL